MGCVFVHCCVVVVAVCSLCSLNEHTVVVVFKLMHLQLQLALIHVCKQSAIEDVDLR